MLDDRFGFLAVGVAGLRGSDSSWDPDVGAGSLACMIGLTFLFDIVAKVMQAHFFAISFADYLTGEIA